MKLITLTKITDGMVLAKDVCTQKGNVLLAKDAHLKHSYANRLQEWGVKSVYVVDARGDQVEIDKDLYREAKDALIQLVQDFYAEFNEEQLSPSLKPIIEGVISKLVTDDNVLQSLVEIKAFNENSFRNTVMDSILSIVLGNSLGMDIHQLNKLAAGAIFIQSGKKDLARNLFAGADLAVSGREIPTDCRKTFDRLWELQDQYENGVRNVLKHYEIDEDSSTQEFNGSPNYQRITSVLQQSAGGGNPLNITPADGKISDLENIGQGSPNAALWNGAEAIHQHTQLEFSSELGKQSTSLFARVAGIFDGYTNQLQQFKGSSQATSVPTDSFENLTITPQQCEATKTDALQVVDRTLAKLDHDLVPQNVIEATRNLYDELFRDGEIVNKLVTIQALDEKAFRHCLRVNSLATIIGTSMGYSPAKLKELGISALMVDTGKLQLARSYNVNIRPFENNGVNPLMQVGKLSFERLWELKTTGAAELNKDALDDSQELNENQNNKLTEVFTLVDVYEVLMNDGMNGQKLMPHEVLEYIRDYYGSFFDPEVSQIFLQNITPFLAGSAVLLNNGEKGKVLRANRDVLARPVVQVFFDKDGNRLPEPIERDLKKDLTIFIASALADQEFEEQ